MSEHHIPLNIEGDRVKPVAQMTVTELRESYKKSTSEYWCSFDHLKHKADELTKIQCLGFDRGLETGLAVVQLERYTLLKVIERQRDALKNLVIMMKRDHLLRTSPTEMTIKSVNDLLAETNKTLSDIGFHPGWDKQTTKGWGS